MISAKVIADSKSTQHGNRITTMELVFPRIILPQVLTHRMFSRNTASSRAIPSKKFIEQVRANPFIPKTFCESKKGMVAGDVLSEDKQKEADVLWLEACAAALDKATQLASLKVAKEHVNRLLEPFSYVTMLVTSTDWVNFFNLRIAHDAQPEIQELAMAMRAALKKSEPELKTLGQWHVPYDEDIPSDFGLRKTLYVAAGRCARVSYLTHDGKRDPWKDMALGLKLLNDGHLSPLEHVARCMEDTMGYANFRGWASLRELERTCMMTYYVPWDSWIVNSSE